MRLTFLLAALVFVFNLFSEANAESAHFNYILHCQGCHLVNGGGTSGKIPALIGVGRFLSVEGGREFLVRVPGVSGSLVNDAELAEVLNWILYEFSRGQKLCLRIYTEQYKHIGKAYRNSHARYFWNMASN